MRGFKNKGSEFSTDFGKNIPQDNYHLGRIQRKAVYFDIYCKQVTIEQSAADNNTNYSEILDLLRVYDIRWREVRRYTVNPDRTCIDILVTAEDLDKVEQANKDYKDKGITLSVLDTISEGVYPKLKVRTSSKESEK
jgi:hypothetical protein